MKNLRIIERDDSLLEIKIEKRPLRDESGYYFRKNRIKELLENEFDKKSQYNFLRTIANPVAISAINERNKTLSSDAGHYRKYDASLMDLYLYTLNKLSGSPQYPLIQNEGVHNLDRDAEQPAWPIIHIIKGDERAVKNFRIDVKSLNNDEAYKIICKIEHPQNYRMLEVDLLKNEKIDPLLIEERLWCVSGDELRHALDFLCTFTYVYENQNDFEDED